MLKKPKYIQNCSFCWSTFFYFRHYLHIQYPVLQIPSPFRGRIRSRLTRYKAFHQSCMPFYKDFFKCAHEVGQPVMHEECWEEFQDMKECESLWKTVRHFYFCIFYSCMPWPQCSTFFLYKGTFWKGNITYLLWWPEYKILSSTYFLLLWIF